MAKYKAKSKTKVIVDNEQHQSNGYSSIILVNIGDCDALVNDNIPLLPGDKWDFINQPDVLIDESTNVRFTGAGLDKRVLVEMIYNTPI